MSFVVDFGSSLAATGADADDVYKEVTGEEEAEPQVDGACSYARALDNCVAFGALLHDQPNLMHQKNEYLELDKLDMWMKIYLEAIYRLAK